MNDLVSEFFYEGIRRIISGLVIIILYWRKEAENVFQTHHEFFSPILFGVCILAIAWLIGFLVEAATFVPFAIALRRIQFLSRLRWFFLGEEVNSVNHQRFRRFFFGEEAKSVHNQSSQVEKPKESGGNNDNVRDKKLEREKRRQGYLNFAEKTMCRCLLFIFLFAYFHPPETFSNLPWHQCYFLFGDLVLLCAWIWQIMVDRSKTNLRPS
jgi:hypothetical protein